MNFLTENADYHVHTVFSDGIATPDELVEIAVSKGYRALGFSDHAYTSFDPVGCMTPVGTEEYKRTIYALKEKYKGKLDIFCGIEQDFYSDYPAEGFDYIIGSVHYIKCDNEFVSVDSDAGELRAAADKYFGGDAYELVTRYYSTVSEVVKKTNADIVGHFDLITKFTETNDFLYPTVLFDVQSPRYKAAWRFAADKLLDTGAVFEINSGAVSRGYRTSPYPAENIRNYIASTGGKFIFCSDNHGRL